MSLRVKTFRITNDAEEQAFNDFIENKIVRHWGTEFAGDGTSGHWNVLIAYEDRLDERRDSRRGDHSDRSDRTLRNDRAKPQQRLLTREKPPKPDFVINVEPADMPLYEAMRKWRNARAKEHDVKPFTLFNNKQLESLVREKPKSADALRSVLPEMSPDQFEKYQFELLGFLSGASTDHQATSQSASVEAHAVEEAAS